MLTDDTSRFRSIAAARATVGGHLKNDCNNMRSKKCAWVNCRETWAGTESSSSSASHCYMLHHHRGTDRS